MKTIFRHLLLSSRPNNLVISASFLISLRFSVCGLPGYSKLNTFAPKQRIYRTNDVVEYTCENRDLLLIGPTKRTCVNGNWEQRIPKCGSYLSGNSKRVSFDSQPKLISGYF